MRIGVDLGGTKIEAAVLDEAGEFRFRERLDTPRGDYDATLRTIALLVRRAQAVAGKGASIGVGTPGSISPFTGLIRNANSQVLNGRPLDRDLERLLGQPIRLANDADCFALSEATDGAAAGSQLVFGVILGTGVGGGVVVGGRLLRGGNGVAGEWGHNPLPWTGDQDRPVPACWCGKQGCIETWLSGPALAADHRRVSGESLTVPQIVEGAAAGDSACESTLARYEDRLARALAGVINLLDPEVIVLGGGLSRLQRLYLGVPAHWSRHVFSDRVATRLLPPRYGDSSGVRGAAWL